MDQFLTLYTELYRIPVLELLVCVLSWSLYRHTRSTFDAVVAIVYGMFGAGHLIQVIA